MKIFQFLGISLLTGSIFAQVSLPPVLEFPVTGKPKAHDEFVLGVIALHSSAYTDAAKHFQVAETIDPYCVMAYWGEAMTHNHPFWGEQDLAGARRVLSKLGSSRVDRAAKVSDTREMEYLNAVEILFGDGDRDFRDFAFADAMKKLAVKYPYDYEAAAFYVLSLLSTRRIGDSNYPKIQAEAAAILQSILEKYPNHPGALHYLMHTYDDPEHATLALDTARKYERMTFPDSYSHAIHMPSHIYLQLGLWPDVARTNLAAYEASSRWVRANHLSVANKDYHSLEFLQYAEMQMGQYASARDAISTMLGSAQQTGIAAMADEAAVIASRFAIETGDWDAIASLRSRQPIPELLFAQGLAYSAKGDGGGASRVSEALAGLITSELAANRRNHAAVDEILKKILDSRIAFHDGRFVDAVRFASDAAQMEGAIGIPEEINGIVKPAAEFYGELLLEMGNPTQAETEFVISLRQRPKRARSLLGLARSRVARNDSEAMQAYRELSEIWAKADPGIPGLQEVRNFIKK